VVACFVGLRRSLVEEILNCPCFVLEAASLLQAY